MTITTSGSFTDPIVHELLLIHRDQRWWVFLREADSMYLLYASNKSSIIRLKYKRFKATAIEHWPRLYESAVRYSNANKGPWPLATKEQIRSSYYLSFPHQTIKPLTENTDG